MPTNPLSVHRTIVGLQQTLQPVLILALEHFDYLVEKASIYAAVLAIDVGVVAV